MADEKKSNVGSKIMSGSPASEYLISGEEIKWQGKPAAIIILGKGLVLTILAIIYMAAMALYQPDDWDIILIALVASFIMIVVDRRLGCWLACPGY